MKYAFVNVALFDMRNTLRTNHHKTLIFVNSDRAVEMKISFRLNPRLFHESFYANSPILENKKEFRERIKPHPIQNTIAAI